MEICIFIYILIGLFVMNNYWKKNHEKEYKDLKEKREVEDGMVILYMLGITIFWPIVLVKNLINK